MGIVSNSLPVKEAIKIEQIKLIKIIINKRNNENNSPFEKGLLFPTKFWLFESIIKLFKTLVLFLLLDFYFSLSSYIFLKLLLFKFS